MSDATLERALVIAATAHESDTGKDGQPFILHCLRVMMAVEGADARIVAVLHDLLERGADWSPNRLRSEGFAADIVEAVDAMTRRSGEKYLDFARRAAANDLARPVKHADLRDNMAVVHGQPASQERTDRLARYEAALAIVSAR